MSSDYGVSKNTESFKVRRKGEVIDKFYVERRKNSTSAPITRWRADFLLTPAVVACYLKKKKSISVHRNEKLQTPGGQPL